MRELSMVEAIREALYQEMAHDDRVMVLGQDVGGLGGVFRATDGLQAKYGPDRVADMPLAEAGIVASAIGLAATGYVPVAEIQFLGFTHQAFHQIGPQLGRMRYRSGGRLSSQVTIRAPFGGLVRTPEHHADAIEAQFAQCPGLRVVMPASAYDAKGMLIAAIREPDPVLFCEPLRGYRLIRDPVPEELYTAPLDSAKIVRQGVDLTLIAWSAAVAQCLDAAEKLADKGIDAQVLDVRSLVPLDTTTILAQVAKTGRAVVVQEAPLSAGLGAEIVATLQEEIFYDLQSPIRRVAAWDTPFPPSTAETYYIPSVARIVDAAERLD